MISLKLDSDTWDIGVNALANIATTDNSSRVAQDVACAVRTFSEECIFDQARGIPYFEAVLGHRPPSQIVNAYVEQEASQVHGVSTAVSNITSISGRTSAGDIFITETTGAVTHVAI